jgi:hypothetical protein
LAGSPTLTTAPFFEYLSSDLGPLGLAAQRGPQFIQCGWVFDRWWDWDFLAVGDFTDACPQDFSGSGFG